MEAAKENGLEGIVAKLRRSPYEPGRRTPAWLKLKIRPEQELVVGGWTPGEGNARDLGAVAVGVYEDGKLRFAGKVGSGFTATTRKRLLDAMAPLVTDQPPFDPPPPQDYRGRWGGDLHGITWIRPELVIRAELGGWTRDGSVRQTSFKGIEMGNDPQIGRARGRRLVGRGGGGSRGSRGAGRSRRQPRPRRRRRPAKSTAAAKAPPRRPGRRPASRRPAWAAEPTELEQLATMPAEGVWHVGGERGDDLKLTNLDKVLFGPPPADPGAAPVTKRELIAYFARIAPTMLPHLAERPLNLQRFPNGADGPSFWQKDIPSSAPAWLRRWREVGVDEREDRKANEHLIADRVATMCWLGNQAAFEVHAWTARLDDPFRPTFALIDIDPGTKTTWEETLVLARLYRTALGHLGVRGYPEDDRQARNPGLDPDRAASYTFADTSSWVEQVRRAIGAIVPDLVSWDWAKARAAARRAGSTTPRTRRSRRSSRRTPSGRRRARPSRRRSAGTSSTTRTCGPTRWTIRTIVDRVAERSATCSPPPRPTSRSCRRSEPGGAARAGQRQARGSAGE